jgi:hypothetical protein
VLGLLDQVAAFVAGQAGGEAAAAAVARLTCPAGVSMPFEPGKTVRFPKGTCVACPLRQRRTSSPACDVSP